MERAFGAVLPWADMECAFDAVLPWAGVERAFGAVRMNHVLKEQSVKLTPYRLPPGVAMDYSLL